MYGDWGKLDEFADKMVGRLEDLAEDRSAIYSEDKLKALENVILKELSLINLIEEFISTVMYSESVDKYDVARGIIKKSIDEIFGDRSQFMSSKIDTWIDNLIEKLKGAESIVLVSEKQENSEFIDILGVRSTAKFKVNEDKTVSIDYKNTPKSVLKQGEVDINLICSIDSEPTQITGDTFGCTPKKKFKRGGS